MSPKDKSSNRYILSMGVELLDFEELSKIYGKDIQNEYIVIKFHGQSFVYHQIRKMVGALIQSFQEDCDDSIIVNSFCLNKIPIWLAPGEGLLLDKLNYSSFNTRKDIPEIIELNEEEEAKRVEFKKTNILKSVLEYEEKDKVFTQWLIELNEDKKESHY